MKQAMLGIVLERNDWNCLEAVNRRQNVDTNSWTWHSLHSVGAVRKSIGLKASFPFLCLKPYLTPIGEEMLYECQRAPREERWFVGEDILGGNIWEHFKHELGI